MKNRKPDFVALDADAFVAGKGLVEELNDHYIIETEMDEFGDETDTSLNHLLAEFATQQINKYKKELAEHLSEEQVYMTPMMHQI